MLTGGIDVLMVDYLQRLQAEDKSESRTREVGKLAMGLKTLARQMKIPVVVLSQLNRASSQRQDKTPTMADLRDSGEIEQEADMVWLLHRPSVYDPEKPEYEAEIIVEKNRHGPTLTILAHWDHSVMRWENRRLSHHEERYA
jgi:replicative DNA helicase